MRSILKDSTSQSVIVRAVDTSGLPIESVDSQSPLPTFWYRREGGLKVAFLAVNLSALNSAYASGGLKHISDGYYRLDVPDAALVTGANGVAFGGTITSGVIIGCYVPLTNFDPSGTEAIGLRQGALALVVARVASGSTTTTVTSDLTETTNDHYNGRTITFTSGALLGQSSSITDYVGASKDLTVAALTEAPAQGDIFVIS